MIIAYILILDSGGLVGYTECMLQPAFFQPNKVPIFVHPFCRKWIGFNYDKPLPMEADYTDMVSMTGLQIYQVSPNV